MTNIRFTPIDADQAAQLRRSDQLQLVHADSPTGYPCRQCMKDGEVGQEMILVRFNPFAGSSPYTCPGPIYLHREPCAPHAPGAETPSLLIGRTLAVRAYSADHGMKIAKLVEGRQLAEEARQLLADPAVEYLQAHNAAYGCWLCKIERAVWPRPDSG